MISVCIPEEHGVVIAEAMINARIHLGPVNFRNGLILIVLAESEWIIGSAIR